MGLYLIVCKEMEIMNNTKMISVIMGVHNSSKTKLLEAIDSIKKQTYKNWEFIICDDGSTDNTLTFIKQIAEDDTRIKIISNDRNRGLAFTLNACLKQARGEYIARMDDDDVSLPNRFQTEVDFLEQHSKYSFVSSNYFINLSKTNRKIVKNKALPRKEDFLWTSPFLHPATMFRKSALIKVGGYRVAKETLRAEDYDLFMRMYAFGMYGYNIQIPLYDYYIGQSALKKKSRYIYRIFESKIRFINFQKMELPLSKSILFSIKPLVVGLLPKSLIYQIRTKNNFINN